MYSANSCIVTRIKRSKYLRHYPTLVVFPDGSTFNLRHHEPRSIVKLPILRDDLETDAEKREWDQRRKKIMKLEIERDLLDVDYDSRKYLKFMKRQS